MKNTVMQLFKKREFQLFLLVILLNILFGFSSEFFFTMENIRLLMSIISINAIIATGMTILIVSGGFDLSVGSVFAATGMFVGLMLILKVPIFIAILLTILLGGIIGFINGIIIAKIKINPFILTLGGFFLYRGAAFLIGILSATQVGKANISSISGFPEIFNNIGGGMLWGIEYIFLYMIPIAVIFHLLLINNILFRQNYNIGGNESAARLVGIKVDKIKILNYTMISALSAIAAILRTSRMKAAAAGSGENMALLVIAAVVIGGGSIEGGKGSVLGSFLGVILITTLHNGLINLGVSPYYEKLYIGIFLLIPVLIDGFMKKFRTEKFTGFSDEH